LEELKKKGGKHAQGKREFVRSALSQAKKKKKLAGLGRKREGGRLGQGGGDLLDSNEKEEMTRGSRPKGGGGNGTLDRKKRLAARENRGQLAEISKRSL